MWIQMVGFAKIVCQSMAFHMRLAMVQMPSGAQRTFPYCSFLLIHVFRIVESANNDSYMSDQFCPSMWAHWCVDIGQYKRKQQYNGLIQTPSGLALQASLNRSKTICDLHYLNVTLSQQCMDCVNLCVLFISISSPTNICAVFELFG